MTNNKERTSISINAELFAKARAYCAQASLDADKRFSFSELVDNALAAYLNNKSVKLASVKDINTVTNGNTSEVTFQASSTNVGL
jgi:hypothetical protein